MANLFDVYNDGLLIDHTEGKKLETGETPINISGLTADTTYDKVQVAYAGSYNRSDVPSFKTNFGRNFVLNSSGMNASDLTKPTLIGASSGSYALITYLSDGILITNNTTGTTAEWYYQVANPWTNFSDTLLAPAKPITFSVDVMGTAPQAILRYGFNGETGVRENYQSFDINNTSWKRVSITATPTPTDTGFYFRIQGGNNNQGSNGWTGGETFKFRYVKIEEGNVATDWIPAPEDSAT